MAWAILYGSLIKTYESLKTFLFLRMGIPTTRVDFGTIDFSICFSNASTLNAFKLKKYAFSKCFLSRDYKNKRLQYLR